MLYFPIENEQQLVDFSPCNASFLHRVWLVRPPRVKLRVLETPFLTRGVPSFSWQGVRLPTSESSFSLYERQELTVRDFFVLWIPVKCWCREGLLRVSFLFWKVREAFRLYLHVITRHHLGSHTKKIFSYGKRSPSIQDGKEVWNFVFVFMFHKVIYIRPLSPIKIN